MAEGKLIRFDIHGPREFTLSGREYVIIDVAEDWNMDNVDKDVMRLEAYCNPPEKEVLEAYYGFYDDGSCTKYYTRIDNPEEAAEVIRLYKEIDREVPIWNKARAVICDDVGKTLAVWNYDGAKWHIPAIRYREL